MTTYYFAVTFTQSSSNGIQQRARIVSPDTQFVQYSPSCNGIQQRARIVSTYPAFNGLPCSGSLKEIRGCNADSCIPDTTTLPPPIDCVLGSWGEYSTTW